MISTTTLGGKSGGSPSPGFLLESGEALSEEAFAPFADNLAGGIEAFGDFVIPKAGCRMENDSGPEDGMGTRGAAWEEVVANGVAEWDVSSWSALGSGINGPVHALASWNGDLYVGGDSTLAGGVPANCIARWDGANWYPLGSGVSDETFGVNALTVYNNDLIVAGDFRKAGGVLVRTIARWDGANWYPLGTGMFPIGLGIDPEVHALAVYNGDLIAGGIFGGAVW